MAITQSGLLFLRDTQRQSGKATKDELVLSQIASQLDPRDTLVQVMSPGAIRASLSRLKRKGLIS